MQIVQRLIFICILVSSWNVLLAQDKYFISFSDKNDSPFSPEHPEQFLSQRAIERRVKQGIEISEIDLPVNPLYTQQVAATGAKILYTTKWFNGAVISINHPVQLETTLSLEFVNGAKRVFVSKTKSLGNEDDIFEKNYHFSKSKGDVYSYGQSATQVKMLNGHSLHNNGFQGQGKVIALLDAGFYNVNTLSAFAYLRENNMILGTKDFVNNLSDIYSEHTHGMMVLSILAGFLQGQLVGTAPEASYWLIRTEDASTEQIIEEYNWVAGAEFADSAGVDVINTSLGYTTFDVDLQNHTYQNMDGKTTPISIAAEIAAKRGMIIVVSAGNEGNNAWQYISAPADAKEILTVGSVNADRVRSGFSSIGPSSDGRIKPDIAAMGSGTVVQMPNGTIGTANGTSLSAPVITGLVACLWQALPELSASEIRDLIMKSSSSYNNPDNFLGYGLPDFSAALNGINPNNLFSKSMIVLPNPFSNFFTLKFANENQADVNIKLYNYTGQLLFNINTELVDGQAKIDLPEGLPDGLMIVVAHFKDYVRSAKAIKKSTS